MSQTHALTTTSTAAPTRVRFGDRVLAVAAFVVAVVAMVVAFIAVRDDATTVPSTPTIEAEPWNVPDCPLHGRC
jgi:hypothetical protein